MRKETIGTCELYLGDCMEYMAGLPDKAFDLAIVDPPYGINIAKKISGSGSSKTINGKRITIKNWKSAKPEPWDKSPPTADYFQELFRVSKEQIVWGGNYFKETKERGSKFIAWYKCVNSNCNTTFSNIEYAWMSLSRPMCCFAIKRHSNFVRYRLIHPTQKPVLLYRKLLEFYAKPGWRILDTHGGSFSSAVAALEMGFDYVGIEIDEDYYNAAVKRVEAAYQQGQLFKSAG